MFKTIFSFCAVSIILPSLAIGFIGFVLIAAFSSQQGESPAAAQGNSAQVVGGNADVGPVDTSIPPILARIYSEAGSKVGVPVALLAAIAQQECPQLWTATRKSPEVVQGWIDKNIDVDSRGCGFDNGSRVWGPMQFQDTTFGIPRGSNAKAHPVPQPGSFGDQAGKLTGHQPASMLNIRDSVYAAALKLRLDSRILVKTNGRTPNNADWEEQHIRLAAGRYFGACVGKAFGKTVYYCDDIVRRWRALNQ